MVNQKWSAHLGKLPALQPGVAAQIASIAILGISGLLLNIAVVRWYSIEEFGLFSMLLTTFLLLGQINVGGFGFAALHYFSTHSEHPREHRPYLSLSSLGIAVTGLLTTIVAWYSADWVGELFSSPDYARHLPLLAVAAVIFSFNKFFILSLNGMDNLEAAAWLSAVRLPLFLLCIVLTATFTDDDPQFGAIFLFTELAILAVAMITLIAKTMPSQIRLGVAFVRLRSELNRSLRGFLIGLSADVNSKIDILVLSALLDQRAVGIYAFGAFMAEGIAQFITAVQNAINPQLGRLLATRTIATAAIADGSLGELKSRLSIWLRAGIAALFLPGLFVVWYLGPLLSASDDLAISAGIYTILMFGIIIAAPQIALFMALNQAGEPIAQTSVYLFMAMINLVLNIALIPLFGIFGAAIGTVLAFGAGVLLNDRLLRGKRGVNIVGS